MSSKMGEFKNTGSGSVGIVLASDGGAATTDIGLKIGSTGSMHPSAKFLTMRTGVGSVGEAEYTRFSPRGMWTSGEIETTAVLICRYELRLLGTDTTWTPSTGNAETICGRSSIAAGAADCTIVNSLCTTGSILIMTPAANDATCTRLFAQAGAGEFYINGNALATSDVPFYWMLINPVEP